jgi:hypothetical protein
VLPSQKCRDVAIAEIVASFDDPVGASGQGSSAALRGSSKESIMGRRSAMPTTDAEAAAPTASELNQQTAFAKYRPWLTVKAVLSAALICGAPICPSSAQESKVSVDMMGIGSLSCAHWQSTRSLRLEGTIWIYGFWTGLNYVAAASEQTQTKIDAAAVVAEVEKACAQRPSQVLASAAWTAYLDHNKR